MASNWTVCGVCDFRNINKASVVWCSECDEGLCDECCEQHGAVKSSRNHCVISVTDYQKLPIKVLEITQTCPKHKEQYQTFCKKHDCPCCRRCVIETHNECKDLMATDDIVRNIKSSNAFLEIEQILDEMLENVEIIRKDRKENLKCLHDQRVKIALDIYQTRKMINDHLDRVQENLMKTLYANEENEGKKIKQLLSKIDEIEKGITEFRVNLTDIKQHASELQTFLALKHIEKDVSDKEELIQFVIQGENMRTKYLSLEVNKEVQHFCKIQNFGAVDVESKSCKVVIGRNKHQQAQMMVPISIAKCIDDIKLSKKMKMNLQSAKLLRGCAILPNGKMLFCDYNNQNIIALHSDGTLEFEITLDTKSTDIAYIEKENTIAVTNGSLAKLIYIDLNSRSIKRSIKTSSTPYGIALLKNALVYCKLGEGIMEIQLNGESEKSLVHLNMPSFSYVAVHDGSIYYTNKDNHSVSCFDIHRNLKWEFKDTQNLQYPQGMSVDDNGNVYVAGRDSNNVVVISPDGKRCRTILSSCDGISRPRALHFEPNSNKLLITNEKNFALLYDVS